MERLEVKCIKGKSYYYYSKWGWKDGKCRRIWQQYLGTAEAVLKKLTSTEEDRHQKALYAEVFQFGLPFALWKESQKARIIEVVDKHCKKRDQGLSVGNYIAIAAINRAYSAVSKLGMWEWFSQTTLKRLFSEITEDDLSSQQFWNHLDKISAEDCQAIWSELITHVIDTEKIDLSSVSYDGTNFYTFIDTFNGRCSIAKRGKNKQGRAGLRQINYSLFCTADGHLPLLYDAYEGNRNDFTQFPIALDRFQRFFEKIADNKNIKQKMTVIFDKGNCSEDNFIVIDESEFFFVTSAKLDEHKELASISNQDAKFIKCSDDLERTKAFRAKKRIHGKERIAVVTYSESLFEAQWATLQADIAKAICRLSELHQKLRDRANGLLKTGTRPTQASLSTQCKEILSRERLKDIIDCKITVTKVLKLEFIVNKHKLKEMTDTKSENTRYLRAEVCEASNQLSKLRQALDDYAKGVSKRAAPTQAFVDRQCKKILSQGDLKDIITYNVTLTEIPKLDFAINQTKLNAISDTYLGKNIIITNREEWSDSKIISAYRSQYIIEEVFKETKDRKHGSWWPQYHWTDSKIYVHALYCTIALLLRAIMKRRVSLAGKEISMNRLLTELGSIYEVVNVYEKKGAKQKRAETVLSKLSEVQESLATILGLSLDECRENDTCRES